MLLRLLTAIIHSPPKGYFAFNSSVLLQFYLFLSLLEVKYCIKPTSIGGGVFHCNNLKFSQLLSRLHGVCLVRYRYFNSVFAELFDILFFHAKQTFHPPKVWQPGNFIS
jgi:hypothetical protein